MVAAMPAASQSPWRHLPNAISMLRVVLVAPICWLLLHRSWSSSLAFVAVAGVSDGVDGFLARHYGWQSRLGGMLDAIADKLLLVSCFVILAWLGEVPWWLTLIVCARDLLIASGAVLWRLLIGRIYPQPSLLSKACTFMQIVYLVCVLMALARWPAPSSYAFMWLVAGLCVVSGLDYVVRWSHRAWQARHAS
ncbi:CDP-alcohol phosphatidyltransferase family protein [Dyella dinghuensis]|uniref:CDP-diacylglycerol--glycerol-3-phosphate 3-phosphatidyltransferase n=1 Tax=Dyella dinghuensis TaxID=1920169 RepID=A0A3S0PBZ6_9GAMM|nr:CDP-alcohol phosphatidyltransferase family protein [Dyella dinghuensis]RUL63958.1 CDP-alcohol phosphatidyltransferase family protein [Dyella dinghuensis]